MDMRVGAGTLRRPRGPGRVVLVALLVALLVGGGLVGWWAGGALAGVLPPSRRAGGSAADGEVAAIAVALVCLVVVGVLLPVRQLLRRVDDGATAEAAAAAPLLAHLTAPDDPAELPALDPGSRAALAFRHLRVTTRGASGAGPTLVVVAGLSHGLTRRLAAGDLDVWVGANLAVALAGAGCRVLLVDGRLGDRCGRPADPVPPGPGLLGVLSGSPLADATSPGPVDRLSVLPPGPPRAPGDEPARDLLRRCFAERVVRAVSDVDVVVVLGPPVDRSADALVMAASGRLLLTVRAGRARVRGLRTRCARVRADGVELLGVVLIGREATSRRP